jgi:excisionase family DNA binding protein
MILMSLCRFRGNTMDIKLENLSLLPEILSELKVLNQRLDNPNEKRWFGVDEIAKYLGYSKDHIYKLKTDSFIENLHFYKKGGKILFDRVAVDEWVVKGTINETLRTTRQAVDRLLLSVKTI